MEFSKGDMASDRLRVLGLVDFLRLKGGTIWIWFSRTRCAGERSGDMSAGRGHDAPIETCNRNLVTGLGDRMLCLRVKLWIGFLQKIVHRLCRLNVAAVVDEFFDRHAGCEFRHTTKVVAVPVGRDEVLDLLQAGILHRSHNASSVSHSRCSAIARINQNRLSGGSDEKCRIPAFDIDDIDIQCP